MHIFHSLTDPDLIHMLQNGAVGVLPTDTLYGLVGRADNPEAVERMYALKHRERKPGTTIAANAEQLIELGIDRNLVVQAARYWPAPLSIIFPLNESLYHVHQGVAESPFRVVADEHLRMLLQQTGPLMTSSANMPGEPPAHDLREAQAYFGDHVDFYVDAGEMGKRQPSTIARITDKGLVVLRQGAAKIGDK